MKPLTKKQIALRLRQLANKMEKLGVEMDYYGGFAEWSKHGGEMVGAANIARKWAIEIEKGLNEND